jgi:hypothetical protein
VDVDPRRVEGEQAAVGGQGERLDAAVGGDLRRNVPSSAA